ncbi:uncharacterized protein LOC125500936 [Athalia rosae]|uniref:uncharacterized protein LOC125500936 n=1 Tax=Athalia rosae TaxID=37344 RepID=UPI002034458E|nr:uncharacterized protein LOC125500936 [Athalia rosae]
MNRNSSFEESADEKEVFRDFNKEAPLIIQSNALPKECADQYALVYQSYNKWKEVHKSFLSVCEENNLIIYLQDLQNKMKPSSLWSMWSMLMKTLSANENIDLNKFVKLKNLLKNCSKGYRPKKSAVLKWQHIEEFMNRAPDHDYSSSTVSIVTYPANSAPGCQKMREQ